MRYLLAGGRWVVALALASLIATACASTKMTSMAAPELAGRSFDRVLVIANIGDLGLRQEAENAFANRAHDSSDMVCDPICRYQTPGSADWTTGGTVFLPGYTLLFPGRNYSPAQIDTILKANRVEATLVVTPTAAGVTDTYIPPSYTTTCTSWTLDGGCSQSNTTSRGGMLASKPWAAFSARMYDIHDGRVIWVSTSQSGGNAFANASTLVRSMAGETIAHLMKDKVVR